MKLSLEIFPTKNNLFLTHFFYYKKKLLLKPIFISVTFGAGGSDYNNNTVLNLFKKKKFIAPHISSINIKIENFKNIINFYYINNIKKLIILKGDGNEKINSNYYSYNLLKFIKKNYINYFKIYSSLYTESHPNSFDYKTDYRNIIIKNNLSIKYNITQYFYNIDSYYNFIDNFFQSKKNKKDFLIPGIMPINSVKQIIKFSNICKSDISYWLAKKINNFNLSLLEIHNINMDIIINLCFKLLKIFIKHIHFYTMNNIKNTNNLLEKMLSNKNV